MAAATSRNITPEKHVVTMEIRTGNGAAARTVRDEWLGSTARTVRQLFQVGWSWKFPATSGASRFRRKIDRRPELTQVVLKLDAAQETPQLPPQVTETDATAPLGEAEPLPALGGQFEGVPFPASTTDASLQLARQVAR